MENLKLTWMKERMRGLERYALALPYFSFFSSLFILVGSRSVVLLVLIDVASKEFRIDFVDDAHLYLGERGLSRPFTCFVSQSEFQREMIFNFVFV